MATANVSDVQYNSKRSRLNPFLRTLLYPMFHFISPNAPSAWILLYIRSNVPWIQFKLPNTYKQIRLINVFAKEKETNRNYFFWGKRLFSSKDETIFYPFFHLP